MLLVWSMTEVIRYSFYAFTLLGGVPYPLLWLRYTTFYVLYPIGVLSEATAIYATLPVSSPWRTYDFVRAFFFVIWWPCTVLRFLDCAFHAERNSSAICTLYAYDQAKTQSSWRREDCQTGMKKKSVCFINSLGMSSRHVNFLKLSFQDITTVLVFLKYSE